MKLTAQEKLSASRKGFTLIEMLVAATILATLAGGVLLALNPLTQINKSRDAQRQADLQAIKTALDLYYSDNECYPANNEIPFGNEWRVNNTVYMKKVPQDPGCRDGEGTCYRYRTDTSASCPQWNVLFAQLSKESALANTCALSTLSDCTPDGYEDGVYACTLSGAVACDNLELASLGSGLETVSPTSTPTPIPSATPTPTPTPPTGSVTYAFSNPGNTDPDVFEATIMPLFQTPGNGQAIRVLADDATANITSMKVTLYSDGDAREFTLTLVGGTAQNGTWEGAWQVIDTYNQVEGRTYGYDITATDSNNNTKTANIRVSR